MRCRNKFRSVSSTTAPHKLSNKIIFTKNFITQLAQIDNFIVINAYENYPV